MTKTKGIQVIWPTDQGSRKIDEIEYFYGIDVNQLDHIREFARELTRVEAIWPQYDSMLVEYAVCAYCESNLPDEVRLVVTYDQEKNPEIVNIIEERNDDHHGHWGTNTIVLQQECKRGHYRWRRHTGEEFEGEWKAFDLGAGRAQQPRATSRTKREARFRADILACDNHRCVLTEEATIKALDAAHLIPAATGENDVPPNGITLRTDLHRLFDAGLFTFGTNGQVVKMAPELSPYYHKLLQDRCLPCATFKRVGMTLALQKFQNHPSVR